jgi:hypothetical protein
MKEQILNLRNKGLSYKDIQKELNCSLGTISYYCGDNQKEKTAERRKRKRIISRKWLEDLKDTLICTKCGEDRNWVLDFHHIDSTQKENTISKLIKSSNKVTVLKEIEKCIVLCANCHRDLHYQNK